MFSRIAFNEMLKRTDIMLKHFELHNVPHERYFKVVIKCYKDNYDLVFEEKYADEDKKLFENDSSWLISNVNQAFFGPKDGRQ